MPNQTIYTYTQLLSYCNAPYTQTNCMIAQTIINMYMITKNFFQSDIVECMNEFLTVGNLNFRKYNLQF